MVSLREGEGPRIPEISRARLPTSTGFLVVAGVKEKKDANDSGGGIRDGGTFLLQNRPLRH